MPRGGRRPGAGRKRMSEMEKLRALMDRCITPAMWQALIEKMYKEALSGGKLGAATLKLLADYYFPVMTEMGLDEADLPPIRFIHFGEVDEEGKEQEAASLPERATLQSA